MLFSHDLVGSEPQDPINPLNVNRKNAGHLLSFRQLSRAEVQFALFVRTPFAFPVQWRATMKVDIGAQNS
jgi:hypothetical protein